MPFFWLPNPDALRVLASVCYDVLTISKTPTISIPAELWAELEALSKRTVEILNELRCAHRKTATQPVIPARKRPKHVPEDQAWFWTPQWQQGEQEADEALARGDYVEFDDVEQAIQYLHDQV